METCERCGQKDWGQVGEHPCPACDLPQLWDEIPESMMPEQFASAQQSPDFVKLDEVLA